jgi:hypothetical protein
VGKDDAGKNVALTEVSGEARGKDVELTKVTGEAARKDVEPGMSS